MCLVGHVLKSGATQTHSRNPSVVSVQTLLISLARRILPLDLLICESLPSKAEEATKMFGHIDVLILAAGILQVGHFKDVPPEVDRRVMEVDYFGQRTLIQEVLPGELHETVDAHTSVSNSWV